MAHSEHNQVDPLEKDSDLGSLEGVWSRTKHLMHEVHTSVLPNVELLHFGLEHLPIPALEPLNQVAPTVLPIVGGLLSGFSHDPVNEGGRGLLEKIGVGGLDTLLGLKTGPAGLIDSFTGGNLKGMVQGGFSSLLSLTTGDTRQMEKQSDRLQQGQYGGLTAGLSSLGDLGGQLMGKLLSGSDMPIDTTRIERNLGHYTDEMDKGSNWNPVNWVPKLGKEAGTWLGDKLFDANHPQKDLDTESRKLVGETDEIDKYSDRLTKLGLDPQQLKVDANMKDDMGSRFFRDALLDQVRDKKPAPKEESPFSMWED